MKNTLFYILILGIQTSSSYSQTKTGQWIVCQGYYAGLTYTIEEEENGLWQKVNDSNSSKGLLVKNTNNGGASFRWSR